MSGAASQWDGASRAVSPGSRGVGGRGGVDDKERNGLNDAQTRLVYDMVKDLQEQLHTHIFNQQRVPPYLAAAPPQHPLPPQHPHQDTATPATADSLPANHAAADSGMQHPSVESASDVYGPLPSAPASQYLSPRPIGAALSPQYQSPTMSYQSGTAAAARLVHSIPPLALGGEGGPVGSGGVDSDRGGSSRGDRSLSRNGKDISVSVSVSSVSASVSASVTVSVSVSVSVSATVSVSVSVCYRRWMCDKRAIMLVMLIVLVGIHHWQRRCGT